MDFLNKSHQEHLTEQTELDHLEQNVWLILSHIDSDYEFNWLICRKRNFSPQLLLMIKQPSFNTLQHFLSSFPQQHLVLSTHLHGSSHTVCIIILRTAAGVYSCRLQRHNRPQELVSQSWTLSPSVKIATWPIVLSPDSTTIGTLFYSHLSHAKCAVHLAVLIIKISVAMTGQ